MQEKGKERKRGERKEKRNKNFGEKKSSLSNIISIRLNL